MTETEQSNIPVKTAQPNVRVIIDRTDIEKEKDAKIEELSKQLGEKNEQLQRYGETAMLQQEPQVQRITNMDWKNSDVPPEWIRAKDFPELFEKIEFFKKNAQNGSEFKAIENKLLKKALTSPKPLSLEFQGSSKDFLKSPLSINEFDDDLVKKRKEAYNERLRVNRTNWKEI